MLRLAQRSHLVLPARGEFLPSRHLAGPPAAIFSARVTVWASSLSPLTLARLSASYLLRDTRCVSAQGTHLVCPSMAGSPQCRQRPSDLAFSSLSLNCFRCLSFLASGVRGILFSLGSLGAAAFLSFSCVPLFGFALLELLLSFLAGTGIGKESTKSCLFERCIPLLPVERSLGHPVGDSGSRGRVPVAH